MKKMKHQIKKIINTIQDKSCCNILTDHEEAGIFAKSTNLKLFRGSQVRVPFALGRTIRGTAFEAKHLDPFSTCLSHHDLEAIDIKLFANELLETLINERSYQITDILPNFDQHPLSDLPAYAISFPWEEIGIRTRAKLYPELLESNRRQHLSSNIFDDETNINEYNYAVSHARQYAELGLILSENGFDAKLERPGIYILKRDKAWRWIMSGNGNHRAHLMFEMNKRSLPVSIRRVIDRAKSEKWKNVKNGEFSQEQALGIFDLVFDGNTRLRGCI